MKVIEIRRHPPQTEIRDAVAISARLGHGIQTVARRHGLRHQEVFELTGEAIDIESQRAFRRGYAAGRRSMLPNLLGRVA
jgi:hypothetical protein